LLFRLVLPKADVGELGVSEGAEGDLAACGGAVGSGQIVADGAKVVKGDMGEVGGAGAIAHRPDAGYGGLQAVVDLNVAVRGGFDSNHFEAKFSGIGGAARGDKEVGALDSGFAAGQGEMECDRFARGAFDTRQGGIAENLDAFVVE